MEKRAPLSPSWRWITFIAVCAATVALFVYQFPIPSVAQQTPPATETPAPPAAAPAEPTPAPAPPAPAPAAAPASKQKAEELTNQSCYDCHNPDILKLSKEELADQVAVEGEPKPPRAKPLFVFGKLSLSIEEKAYAYGVHADTTCVSCHSDVKDLPHAQRLKRTDCKECHEDSVAAVQASAHAEKPGPKAIECIGCHDVHFGKGQKAYAKDFQSKLCIDCHKAYSVDIIKGHQNLYEYDMHMKLGCLICHQGDKAGVHFIPKAKGKAAQCESCHTRPTILSKEKPKPVGLIDYIKQTGFINADVLKKYGYVLGANRVPALDAIIILAVLAPLGLPLVHGGLRILTRRRGPIHLPEEKIYLHPFIERIWHWFQAVCIVMLIFTGILLHWPEKFPGWFQWAVSWHNWFGWAAVIAWVVWFIYNLITGRIKHYFPQKGEIPKGMITQAKFYGYGIFKHEPHPYAPSEDNKFNPLQKIAYLQFQLLLFPILLISGLLYMYPETFKGVITAIGGMTVLALIHYILGALFAAFLVAHLYLATTGETVGENFKAIITGYGTKEEHGKHA